MIDPERAFENCILTTRLLTNGRLTLVLLLTSQNQTGSSVVVGGPPRGSIFLKR